LNEINVKAFAPLSSYDLSLVSSDISQLPRSIDALLCFPIGILSSSSENTVIRYFYGSESIISRYFQNWNSKLIAFEINDLSLVSRSLAIYFPCETSLRFYALRVDKGTDASTSILSVPRPARKTVGIHQGT